MKRPRGDVSGHPGAVRGRSAVVKGKRSGRVKRPSQYSLVCGDWTVFPRNMNRDEQVEILLDL